MFQENDVVLAKHSLDKVPAGALGAVLMVFDNGVAYLVEFVDREGTTLNVLTVTGQDIELWKGN